MAEIGKLVAVIGGDISGLQKALGDAEKRVKSGSSQIANDLRQVEVQVGKTAGAFSRIRDTAAGFLSANLITQGLNSLVSGVRGAISSASQLNESQNAVNVVFRESADQIRAFGEQAATSVGLSQAAFQRLSTPLGSMLRNAGFSMDETADKTIQLTKRAADMASVFDTTVPDALNAIQAALRGESDPIERYGVSLTEAAVKARAAALGFKTVNGELDAHAKAAARLSLIMEQTAQTEGDFAKTAGDVANANRTLGASFTDLQAKIGTKLAPLIKDVQKAFQGLIDNKDFTSALTSGLDTAVGVIQGFAAGVKAAFDNVIIPAFQWIIDNRGAVEAALVAIGVAFAVFFPGGALLIGLGLVTAAIGVMVTDVNKASPEVLKLRLAFLGIAEGALNAFDSISGVIATFIGGPMELLRQAINGILDGFNSLNSVKTPFGKIGLPDAPKIPDFLKSLLDSGSGAIRDRINADQASTLEALNNALTEVGGSATKTAAVAATLPPVLNATADALGKLGQSALDVLNQAASSILGKPSREQANLQLEIAKQERALQAGQSGGNNLNAGAKAFMEQQIAEMKAQLSLLEQERGIQKARLQAADQTLLTERQIGQAVALLETNIRGVSSRIVQGFAGPGGFIPELANAAKALRDFMTSIATGKLPEGVKAPTADARAAGGPVKKDVPFIVGEKGEELFIPKQDGVILPAGSFRTAADGAYGSQSGGMMQDVERWARTGFPGGEPLSSPEYKAFFAKWGQRGADAFIKRWRELRNLVQISPNVWGPASTQQSAQQGQRQAPPPAGRENQLPQAQQLLEAMFKPDEWRFAHEQELNGLAKQIGVKSMFEDVTVKDWGPWEEWFQTSPEWIKRKQEVDRLIGAAQRGQSTQQPSQSSAQSQIPNAGGSVAAFSARANGGPVEKGTPFLVGEEGQELFIPTQNGVIIPNGMFRTAADGAYSEREVQQLRMGMQNVQAAFNSPTPIPSSVTSSSYSNMHSRTYNYQRPTTQEVAVHNSIILDGDVIYSAVQRRMPGDSNAFGRL